eukprot:1180488-Prorocentrum_minimum.AAC.3
MATDRSETRHETSPDIKSGRVGWCRSEKSEDKGRARRAGATGRQNCPAEQQGAIAVTSQDAPVRWRLYSEFTLRGVRVVLIEKIV